MRKITQAEMAKAIGKNQSAISKYINKQLEITVADALKLRDVFGIPVEIWAHNPKSYFTDNRKKERG